MIFHSFIECPVIACKKCLEAKRQSYQSYYSYGHQETYIPRLLHISPVYLSFSQRFIFVFVCLFGWLVIFAEFPLGQASVAFLDLKKQEKLYVWEALDVVIGQI